MGIVQDLTPTQYSLIRIGLQQDGSDVIAIGDMQIRNAAGQVIAHHAAVTELTPNEKQALIAFAARELAIFESLTGLTRYVEPEEPT